jgi:hypothetical protein
MASIGKLLRYFVWISKIIWVKYKLNMVVIFLVKFKCFGFNDRISRASLFLVYFLT